MALRAVALILAVVLLPAPSSATTDATLNVYRGNPGAHIRSDLWAAMDRADALRLQELYAGRPRRSLHRVLEHRPNWRMSAASREVPIVWDSRVWRRVAPDRARQLTTRQPGPRGYRFPARWLTWVTLQRVGSGRVVTIANTHADPRTCRHGISERRRAAGERVWRGVARWSTRQLDRRPGRPVLLGGDFNCPLSARWRPWFPGVILRELYRFDAASGPDHLLTSRGTGGPDTARSWSLSAFSDHRLHLRTLWWYWTARAGEPSVSAR